MGFDHQAPLSVEFSRHEYWSGLPFPSPGDLLDPGIGHRSPAFQADYLPSEPPGKPSVQLSILNSLVTCSLVYMVVVDMGICRDCRPSLLKR